MFFILPRYLFPLAPLHYPNLLLGQSIQLIYQGVDLAVKACDLGLEGLGFGFLFIEVGHPLGFFR